MGISIGVLIGSTAIFYIIFLYAYFILGKFFSISINSVGEADFELVFLTACMVVTTSWLWKCIRR